MTSPRAYAKKQAKTTQRRRLQLKRRLDKERQEAQRDLVALHQALLDLGLAEHLVTEIEGRLRAQHKLLGKIFGLMFPTLFGCRHLHELTRVRGWDKNRPAEILGALPKRSWLKRLKRLGLDVLVALWRHTAAKSPATHSRWQWTWAVDDTVFRKYGRHFGLVGTWYSGQHKRVVPGIDGVLLVVVVGDGKLVVPVDFTIRRPDPKGPGGPCRDKLTWAKVMLDDRLAAFARRGVQVSAPVLAADSWFSDSDFMIHMEVRHQGTLLVQGKSSYVFRLPDSRRVTGHDFLHEEAWPWRQSLHAPGCRYARLRARSRTFGAVTILIVDAPHTDRFYLLCRATERSATRLLRAWRRRHWIEQVFRTLKHLLATDACQVRSEDAYYGHVVLRLMAGFVLFYTSRVIYKGRVTMEEIVGRVKHHWTAIEYEPLDLYAFS